MIGICNPSSRLALLVVIGLTQMPAQAFSQAKAEQPEPPPFVELPAPAADSLGGEDIANVLVFSKEGLLSTYYGPSVSDPQNVVAPPGLVIDVQNANDPDKDIVVTATIPRSALQVPGQSTEPIEVIPAILIKGGPSTCGWVYFVSAGTPVCQRVCW